MRIRIAVFTFAVVAAVLGLTLSPAAQESFRKHSRASGVVFAMTNDPRGNAVLKFRRATNGLLAFEDRQATGGLGGTGNGVGDVDPLGSQDSLVVNGDGSRIVAVNAGSDEISAIDAGHTHMRVLSTARSGGDFPNSVALWKDLVYVLNAHGTPNVTGFRLTSDGLLQPLAGSTRSVPGGAAAKPHDVKFTPDGTRLLVTAEGTNQIAVFDLDDEGLIKAVNTQPSSGPAPFGFDFARDGVVVVTEAASASASSYRLTTQNALQIISPSVPNGQAATCWIALTREGHAFVSNTASSTLSAYHVANDGHLALVDAVAANTGAGSAPIDVALSGDNDFLYAIDSALGRILIFSVDGTTLTRIGTVSRLPKTIQGIAVR
jgi:6-phosphogluconolactonase